MSNTNQSLLEEFKKINPKNIKNNIFQDLEFKAYCFNVHDPDTISVLFKYNSEVVKYNIRLSGIDAPELHSKNVYEKELCIKGTNYLKELILNKLIQVKTYKIDKYGRMLADIFILDLYSNLTIVNKDLINKGYCREYSGGAKKEWNLINADQLQYENNVIDDLSNVIKSKRKYTKRKKLEGEEVKYK